MVIVVPRVEAQDQSRLFALSAAKGKRKEQSANRY